ncbi:hypothetical protein B0H10DRAFT_2269227 [Mycena sp. CBHHK59/15]|nr:hypothetical protein B0H10DRAFT_2269227 [Mycena sp. CBHHK59/15]
MSEVAAGFLPPPPPPGLNYIAAIKPSLTLLMIGTVWSSMLIPLLIVLLLFSNSSLRRQPLFIMNVISVFAGIVLGIMNIYLETTAIVSPLTPIKASVFIGYTAIVLYLPVFMDTILFVRLLAVYPPQSISWVRRVVVFGPPITFKIVRVSNLVVFLVKWAQLVKGSDTPLFAGQALWGTQPWTKIEWFFQVFDNFYTSILFLLRVHKGRNLNSQSGALNSGGKKSSHSAKLRNLFYIALGNFVFPCMLSLVQLIFLFRDPSFLDGTYVFLTNCYVEIIGVLLATIWVAGSHWSEQHNFSASTQISAIRYNGPQIRIGKSVVTDSAIDESTVGAGNLVEMDTFRNAPKYGESEHVDMDTDGHGKQYRGV